jgi:iron complex transport system substrate-binding protein
MKKFKIIIPVLLVTSIIWTGVWMVQIENERFHAEKRAIATLQPVVQRIVSLAPSITESLFELGLGDKIVGVTRYCRFPGEVKDIAKVGGFLDPNIEAILRVKPDLVVTSIDNREIIQKLQSIDIRTLVIRQKTLADILETMRQIGRATGKDKEATDWVENAQSQINAMKKRFENANRPRVLVSMTRVFGEGKIREVYVAGQDNFYDDLVQIAGGRNAYDGSIIKTPSVSAEGIIELNPDVIIDLVPMLEEQQITPEAAQKEWQSLSTVSAVQNHRVYVLTGDYTVVPGPRIVKALTDFAAAIHPEIKEEVQR